MADNSNMLMEVAQRIRELRIDYNYTEAKMAELTGVSTEEYIQYETGAADLPFTFIHKCALCFGIEITELLEGSNSRLTSYAITRNGNGQLTAKEPGIEIKSIAPLFKNKKADPYWVRYEYSEAEQNEPIHQVTHGGQEFDLILEGNMRIKIGDHEEELGPGDSIFYNSSTPHGMIAIGGKDVVFCAVILSGEEELIWNHGRMMNAEEVQKQLNSVPAIVSVGDYLHDFIETAAYQLF